MGEGRFSEKAATTPEYLRADVPGRDGERFAVIVNGERVGETGRPITLSTGTWEVSVDVDGTPTIVIALEHTTINRPMIVEIPLP